MCKLDFKETRWKCALDKFGSGYGQVLVFVRVMLDL
jgi:hypothetical protein